MRPGTGQFRIRSAPLVLAAPTAWRVYLCVLAVPVALAPPLLNGPWEQTGLTVAVGWTSALACLWRYRTGRGVPRAWLWIGAGLALNASGAIVEAVEEQVLKTSSSPTPADLLYVAFYPCATVGLLMLVRSRYPDMGRAKLVDAGTLAVGLGLVCWIFLIRPTADSATGPTLARLVAIADPVGDLMLLAILARVLAAEGWRSPVVRLISLGIVGSLIGDSGWAIINQNNINTTNLGGAALSVPFLVAFALVGAAALHPSARELERPAPPDGGRMSPVLLALLTLASLVAPAILAEQTVSGRVVDGIAIALCSATLMCLVIARMSYLVEHVERQARALGELALQDPLAGLPNRRALESYLTAAIRRARRHAEPIALALIDLDHFKRFNDQRGHAAGDGLLRAVAASWTGQIRSSDILARIGGEEFVLVLAGADIDQAEDVVAKLRDATPLGQTFSAGVAQWDGEAGAEQLVGWADAAMYAAKGAGRNRTMRAGAPVAGAATDRSP